MTRKVLLGIKRRAEEMMDDSGNLTDLHDEGEDHYCERMESNRVLDGETRVLRSANGYA